MKNVFWSLVVLMSFLMLNACKDLSPSSPYSRTDSTWKYEGLTEDTITLGEDSLTYNSKPDGRRKTVPVTIKEEVEFKSSAATKDLVSRDQRILAWISDPNKSDAILAVIYTDIEWLSISPPDPENWRDIKPERLQILSTSDLSADLTVPSPYCYTRQ